MTEKFLWKKGPLTVLMSTNFVKHNARSFKWFGCMVSCAKGGNQTDALFCNVLHTC